MALTRDEILRRRMTAAQIEARLKASAIAVAQENLRLQDLLKRLEHTPSEKGYLEVAGSVVRLILPLVREQDELRAELEQLTDHHPRPAA